MTHDKQIPKRSVLSPPVPNRSITLAPGIDLTHLDIHGFPRFQLKAASCGSCSVFFLGNKIDASVFGELTFTLKNIYGISKLS